MRKIVVFEETKTTIAVRFLYVFSSEEKLIENANVFRQTMNDENRKIDRRIRSHLMAFFDVEMRGLYLKTEEQLLLDVVNFFEGDKHQAGVIQATIDVAIDNMIAGQWQVFYLNYDMSQYDVLSSLGKDNKQTYLYHIIT